MQPAEDVDVSSGDVFVDRDRYDRLREDLLADVGLLDGSLQFGGLQTGCFDLSKVDEVDRSRVADGINTTNLADVRLLDATDVQRDAFAGLERELCGGHEGRESKECSERLHGWKRACLLRHDDLVLGLELHVLGGIG